MGEKTEEETQSGKFNVRMKTQCSEVKVRHVWAPSKKKKSKLSHITKSTGAMLPKEL